jgi:glucosamine-6-phosphate deaminase
MSLFQPGSVYNTGTDKSHLEYPMHIISCIDYAEMSRKTARIIAALVQLKPHCVLGLATGSTPVGTYKELIRLHLEEELDFSNVTTVNLDEYYRLGPEHEQSYRYFMQQNLFDHINIPPENTHVPDGLTRDVARTCAEYDNLVASLGGTDIQLVGIGDNGHIAFNEPNAVFVANTHLVDLDEDTIKANARFFASEADVPRQAITMGMRSIFSAKLILLLASGPNKASAVARMIKGPIDPQLPASILQLHPNVVVIAGKETLALV